MLGDGLCYPRRPAAHLVLFSIFGLFVEIAESNSFLRAAVTLDQRSNQPCTCLDQVYQIEPIEPQCAIPAGYYRYPTLPKRNESRPRHDATETE
jgi:hypothetical protein